MNDQYPFTKASSDYTKFTQFREDEKSALIDFAADDFLSLRASLIEYLKAVYPKDYNLFAESDLGMMFIEMVSYMGSVLSMKADMLAHELFLKTSKNPSNVRKLLELIGVKFKGPSSAVAPARMSFDTVTDSLLETQSLVIPAESRVVEANSPVDGEIVSYSIYTTKNGAIEDPLSDGSLELYPTQSNDFVQGSTPARVWDNIVLIEGSLIQQTGVFTDVDVLREIVLESGPVVEGSVQVLIEGGSNDGVYQEVDSLLSTSSSDAKVFQIVYDDEFNGTVRFGDGVTGAIPSIGSNYYITYRAGGGIRGNAPSNFINTTFNALVSGEAKVMGISNLRPFTGGLDSETIDHAKKYGKMVFRQQDRLVSLDDYAAFGNTYRDSLGNAGKAAAATRKSFSSANVVDVYLLQKANNLQLQKASLSFKKSMLEAMQDKKMITDEVVIVDGLIRTLDLDILVTLDSRFRPNESAIKTKVARAINEYFKVDNREFGESFYPDDVGREIFTNVDEVRIAEVTNYKTPLQMEFNEIIQLNNFTLSMNYV